MTWVQFRLGLPDGSWLADVSRSHPDLVFRTLGVVVDDGVGYTLVSVCTTDPEPVVDDVAAHAGVDDADTLGREEYETTFHVTGEAPRFVTAARRAGLPVEPPVQVVDGAADLEVAGDHERLSELGRELAAVDVAFDVRLVGRYEDATRVLTDAQRGLVLEAVERGYYDMPRECTLTDLADAHGIAKSTCSETLQRAEERLMKRFVAGLPVPEKEGVEGRTPAERLREVSS